MKNMKTTTLPRLGRDASKDPINLLILGNALMDLRGLNTLIVRRAFKLAEGIGVYSMIAIQTTIKSSQFQASRRYAFLCTKNPIAIILKTASEMNIIEKA